MGETKQLSLTLLLSLAFSLTTCGHVGRRLTSSAYGYPGVNATFDYAELPLTDVVVGGGTAGLAIASRLAETASVAVVEAGGFYDQDNSNLSVVPFYALTMPHIAPTPDYPRQPLFDWDLLSVPQTAAAGRTIHYAQAKTLGGCSAHNTLLYLRATRGAHKRWAEIAGDDTYKWDNSLPYFKRSCTLTPPNWEKRDTPNATFKYDPSAFSRGRGGPIQVSWSNWVDPSATWLAEALQSVGLRLSNIGFSSGILSGFSAWTPITVSPRYAERSASTAYLDEAIEDTDIMVYHHTQALKINFDASKKATSVLVSTQGAATEGLEYTLHATKEIILSAGVFHSPQLLMVSGVGPKTTLAHHKIPLVAHLPGVGANLHDPLLFPVSSALTPALPSAIGLVFSPDPAVQTSILHDYLADQAGPPTSPSKNCPPHLRTHLSPRTQNLLNTLPTDWPDVEYIAGAGPGAAAATGGGDGGTTTSSSSNVQTITAVVLNPFSRGTVSLASARMADPPVIDMAWLTDPADGEVAVAALRRAREVWNASVLADVKVGGGEIAPGEGVQSDAEVLGYIKKACVQIWHASSTVFGIRGLRVVDLSVLPFSPPTHPQGTVYALAEKIAEDIVRGR
ncbi:dehydrogenase pate [Chaetomidium leptoderma]|uniref:Dehydrogenase pate n=1 Tax=Chaetomidium leptoderma TaxID=669021 RepID=A0AAN6VI68_9PEZI|nr:dehydrogenase pate [Chaetomidium leptoderma]